MPHLTEEAFTAIVEAGCESCKGAPLVVEALVTQKMTLLAGEVYGAPAWAYKGEDLVRGTYLVACGSCKRELFTAAACPRCGAEGGVARALAQENDFPMPVSCTGCGNEQVLLTAYVPAVVRYEGKRGAKARTQTAPEDEGFHAFRAECKGCKVVAERRAPCPLCAPAET